MYLIDTCIFLEILLDQDKALDSEKLIQKIRNSEIKAYVTSFSLHSIEVILSRFNKLSALEMFLEDILTMANLEIIYANIVDEIKIVKLMKNLKLDFDDSVQYYFAKTKSLKLISFDRDFDKSGIERIEPHKV